jgi:hypothetical protein
MAGNRNQEEGQVSAQLTLSFHARKPRVHFFATTPLTAEDLARCVAIAEAQDVRVFLVFQYARRPLSPSQVQRQLNGVGERMLLTSVRRAISTLTKEGLLRKLDSCVMGTYVRIEHTWEVA